ncbi:unnamed protein product [Dovyalis caffra]|uniref:Uncharacterized protein n=1 Tax=Dovyalis caffra TaxID=77055 RepID=A0AAV1R219_9ROSI|nr:unnamed protein product [Dovyalis caffra]
MSGLGSSDDVEWEQKDSAATYRNTWQIAVYFHKSDNLCILDSKEGMNITLQPSSFGIVAGSPVLHAFNDEAKFAPMNGPRKHIKIKGTGKFLAYSSKKPKEIMLIGEKVEFEWSSNGTLSFEVPWIGGKLSDAIISIS